MIQKKTDFNYTNANEAKQKQIIYWTTNTVIQLDIMIDQSKKNKKKL